jgi:hypothetical protein
VLLQIERWHVATLQAGVQANGKCCWNSTVTPTADLAVSGGDVSAGAFSFLNATTLGRTGSIHGCPAAADRHGTLQIWARVTGQLSTLLMSYTLYPTARNSLWESAFGIPFERAITSVGNFSTRSDHWRLEAQAVIPALQTPSRRVFCPHNHAAARQSPPMVEPPTEQHQHQQHHSNNNSTKLEAKMTKAQLAHSENPKQAAND